MGLGATAASADVNVYAGYADNFQGHAAPGAFPSPFGPGPGVIYEGCQPYASCVFDGGTVRLQNTGTTPVTINRTTISYTGAGCTFDLWPRRITVPAGGSLILAQTESGPGGGCTPGRTTGVAQMDSSDIGRGGSELTTCTQSGVVPKVHVTIAGHTTTVTDSGQVLNTGGVDKARCGPPNGGFINESTPYAQIGTITTGGGPPPTRGGTFTCSATAARLGGNDLIAANPADSPCVTASNSGTPTIAGLTVGLLDANTMLNAGALPAAGDNATAHSDAANVCLGQTVLGICLGIGVKAVSSDASVTCPSVGGTPVFTGSSTLATVYLGGVLPIVSGQQVTVPLVGLVTVYIDRTIRTGNSLTQRALEVDLGTSPLLIVGEAKVDTTGNPCATA
ncbi:MAG: hypothetical protein DLM64_14550 [Solirubrobacterales bacterium]|nr:MAG: hypothetical protein DLM64_14550 [Solirubrobacterales bacterium]